MKCLIKLLGQNTIFYEAIWDTSNGFHFMACLSSNLSCIKKPYVYRFTRIWEISWLTAYRLFFFCWFLDAYSWFMLNACQEILILMFLISFYIRKGLFKF